MIYFLDIVLAGLTCLRLQLWLVKLHQSSTDAQLMVAALFLASLLKAGSAHQILTIASTVPSFEHPPIELSCRLFCLLLAAWTD